MNFNILQCPKGLFFTLKNSPVIYFKIYLRYSNLYPLKQAGWSSAEHLGTWLLETQQSPPLTKDTQ